MIMIRALFIILTTMLPMVLTAQSWDIVVHVDSRLEGEVSLADSSDLSAFINAKLTTFWAEGYVYSGLDSVSGREVFFHQGVRYIGVLKDVFIYDTFTDTYERSRNKFKSIGRILESFGNRGYPFARIQNDSLAIGNHQYSSYLSVYPGDYITYDTLALSGNAKIGKHFLAQALEMEEGAAYSEKTFERVSQRIKRLSYLRLKATPDVAFEKGKAMVFLKVNEQKANRFEGVLGLLPRQSSNQALAVTGFIDLSLANLFKSGKSFDFTWNRFADQSQSLDIGYNHPFLFKSRLFLDVNFRLLRQDTTFLNQQWDLSTGTNLGRRSEIFFAYQNANGSLVSPGELNLESGIADYKSNVYSIGIRDPLYHQDFAFENGFRTDSHIGVGQKEILRNSSVDDEAYDTLDLETQVIKWYGAFKYLVKLRKGVALFQEVKTRLLFNDQVLTNELQRIGGLKTLRGFNENFFYAQHSAYSRLEIRQYFEEASYFMLFYDQAILYQKTETIYPRGFGLGLSLNTSNGLFTFALALGNSQDIPIDPSNIKIHLGYSSRF